MNTVCQFSDWLAWRSQQQNHDQASDLVGGKVHWIGIGNVKQLPQLALKAVASGGELKGCRLVGVVIGVAAHKPACQQKVAQGFKFFFGFFSAHTGKATQTTNGGKNA